MTELINKLSMKVLTLTGLSRKELIVLDQFACASMCTQLNRNEVDAQIHHIPVEHLLSFTLHSRRDGAWFCVLLNVLWSIKSTDTMVWCRLCQFMQEVKDLDEKHSALLTHGEGGRLSSRWKLAMGRPPIRGPYNSSSQLQQIRQLVTSTTNIQTGLVMDISKWLHVAETRSFVIIKCPKMRYKLMHEILYYIILYRNTSVLLPSVSVKFKSNSSWFKLTLSLCHECKRRGHGSPK